MQDLLPPAGRQHELQGHLVSLHADLDGALWAFHFPLLSKTTLVLLQQADAFLIDALQRTNHSGTLNSPQNNHGIGHRAILRVCWIL